MKKKGIILVLMGVLGAIFVANFDKLVGKPVNDISGPKSITALVVCAMLIIIGVSFIFRKNCNK